jgi:hypothetical protein
MLTSGKSQSPRFTAKTEAEKHITSGKTSSTTITNTQFMLICSIGDNLTITHLKSIKHSCNISLSSHSTNTKTFSVSIFVTIADTRRWKKWKKWKKEKYERNGKIAKQNFVHKHLCIQEYLYSLANASPHNSLQMNAFFDTPPPPGFLRRPPVTPASNSDLHRKPRLQEISPLDLCLMLRADLKIHSHMLRISNCPMKAKDIHRLWMYLKQDLGYKMDILPFAPDADLTDNAFDWAHPESTSKRPLLISDAEQITPMRFYSTMLTASGCTHPGWEKESGVSMSFPMYSEHRITLSTFVANPKSKRLESQTRLIQVQPTLITPNCEHYWTPLLIISGLGTAYSSSKSCITGATHAHLRGFLEELDPDLAMRFSRYAQIDWSYFQFTTASGVRRTQPVATLKICKNDPDDQSPAALKYAQKAGPLILGHIFGTDPAAHISHSFCGFKLRVHRVDRSGSLQPLGDILRRDLVLPSPSDHLHKIVFQNLTPYPSLPLIYHRLLTVGLTGIENIAYVQTETSRAPRQNRLDWMNSFQVAIYLTSAGNALALLHPSNRSHISQCLAPVLEDGNIPLILQPPDNLPLVSHSDPMPSLRFPISYPTQAIIQRLYRDYPADQIYQQYAHPPPPHPETPDTLPSAASSSAQAPRNQSPKRGRPMSAASDSPVTLLHPAESDDQLFADIRRQLTFLYQRLPSETYIFVSNTLDEIRDQLSQDGYLQESSQAPDQELLSHETQGQSSQRSNFSGPNSGLASVGEDFDDEDL